MRRWLGRNWLRGAAAVAIRADSRGIGRRRVFDPIVLWPLLGSVRFALAAIGAFIGSAALLTMLGLRPADVRADTLGTLWQVQAALLGLAIAVSIFAYQSLGSAHGSRRRLISLTGHPATIVLGVSLAILTGAAYLGGPYQAARWIGTFAAALTPPWLLVLLFTVAQAPHLQNTRFAIQMRMRVLRRNAAAAVTDQLLARIGAKILGDRLTAAGGEYAELMSPDAGEHVVFGSTSGTVVDISVSSVEKAARLLVQRDSKLRFFLRLGQRAGEQRPIASYRGQPIPQADALLRGALRYRLHGDPTVADDLQDLHEDAVRSIGTSVEVLDQILDAYYEVLGEYAGAWLTFTDVVEAAYIPTWLEGTEAPTATIRNSIFQLLQKSLDGRFREAAFLLVSFPTGVAERAIRWRAPGYFDFLDLYPTFYWLASQDSVASDMQKTFRERAWTHLIEARELIWPAVLRQSDPDAAALVGRAIERTDQMVLRVLRACVREGDIANFREGLRRWRIATR